MKVKLQEGCDLTPKEVANQVAETLGAEFIQAIGHKFTLYRESEDHKKIELPKERKQSKAKAKVKEIKGK